MAKLLVLYNEPADPEAFEKHYFEVHVPITRRFPGVKSFRVSRGKVRSPGQPAAPYWFVAELEFDSVEALRAALASPAGQEAAADIPKYAGAGVSILMFEDAEA